MVEATARESHWRINELFLLVSVAAVGFAIYRLNAEFVEAAIVLAIWLFIVIEAKVHKSSLWLAHGTIGIVIFCRYESIYSSWSDHESWYLALLVFESCFVQLILSSVLIVLHEWARSRKPRPFLLVFLIVAPLISEFLLLPYIMIVAAYMIHFVRRIDAGKQLGGR